MRDSVGPDSRKSEGGPEAIGMKMILERENKLIEPGIQLFIEFSRCQPVPFSKQVFPGNEWGD
mgnify:CR=1 FL=1